MRVSRVAPESSQMPVLNILLVDDDPLVRAVVAEDIEDAGHHVRAVRSGAEALAAFAEDTFDIVLVDYAMPGMTGEAVARRLREIRPHQAVAILTGYEELPELAGRMADLPVIPKGRMDAILKAILTVAEGKNLPPPSAPQSRWEEIQHRMAATASAQLVGQNLRALFADSVQEPLSDRLEALLGDTEDLASNTEPKAAPPGKRAG